MTDYAASRTAMVDRQVRPSDVTRFAIIEAMLWAPRERFVPRAQRDVAYADAPIPLGSARWLLEPRNFAKMLEEADVRDTDLVLDVGSGLGYSTAVISRLAAAVVALESDPDMARAASETLESLERDNVLSHVGPLHEGAPDNGPYDVIMVQGAVATAPQGLLEQLKPGGRLIAIVGVGPHGQARLFRRSAGGGFSSSWVFDATATVLPGFDNQPVFEF
jgi:protein-L-isoaspartate(D-aspartate) O-methyltransferase